MTNPPHEPPPDARPGVGEAEVDEIVAAVLGTGPAAAQPSLAGPRRSFQPWHHPVKQLVRDGQWGRLTTDLVSGWADDMRVLRYFTLPGPDLFDVRVLAEACNPEHEGRRSEDRLVVEYFGFDNSAARRANAPGGSTAGADAGTAGDPADLAGLTAESVLLQGGYVARSSQVYEDRLEAIVRSSSLARERLSRRPPFDVINLDLCDHLAHAAPRQEETAFAALRVLLQHQLAARRPWLLFITTRVAPDLLGGAGDAMRRAIADNMRVAGEPFSDALAAALAADPAQLAAALDDAWAAHDTNFLKVYALGLGKYLLQFYHANQPADVELASTYAYRVAADVPDMLALAFRITPDPQRIAPPSAGGVSTVSPTLEPARARRLTARVQRIQDIDVLFETDADLQERAIHGTERLLRAGNYDVDGWHVWRRGLARPRAAARPA